MDELDDNFFSGVLGHVKELRKDVEILDALIARREKALNTLKKEMYKRSRTTWKL